MEDDAIQPGQPVEPNSPEAIADRLRELEAEAAALREALNTVPAASTVPLEEPEGVDESVAVEAPDGATIEKVEKLLQRYRLEASRGNREVAAQFLKEARDAGPNTSLVLEMLGDDALERRQVQEALGYFAQAKEALPKSVSAEKKHADLVFRTKAKSASLMMSSEFENVASAKSATMFAIFLPGMGHIITGNWAHGAAYLLVYVGAIVWAILTPNGIQGLIAMISNRSQPPLNGLVFVPIFIAAITWISSLISMSTRSKMVGRTLEKTERPVPPENLPF